MSCLALAKASRTTIYVAWGPGALLDTMIELAKKFHLTAPGSEQAGLRREERNRGGEGGRGGGRIRS